MGLVGDIVYKMKTASVSKLAIIVNSQYIMASGKMVYVKLDTDKRDRSQLTFFTVSSDSSIEVIEDEVALINSVLSSRKLFGVTVDGNPSGDNATITVSSSLGLLVIESALFNTARRLAEMAQGRKADLNYEAINVTFSDEIAERPETLANLVTAFLNNTRYLYKTLIYTSGNNRFTNRVLKLHKFYSIQRAFIPVFIDCSLFFNPLKDPAITNTAMYKKAVEMNRFVEGKSSDVTISCYFLTHTEICRAFGMSHFMRFTAGFWYDVFMGLLYPTLGQVFPTKGERRWFAPKKVVKEYGLPTIMTVQEMDDLRNELQTKNTYETSVKKYLSQELLDVLEYYELRDALFTACLDAYHALTSIGPYSIDNKKEASLQNLYTYISEAHIVV